MLTPDQLRNFPWSHLSWLIVNEGELEQLLHAFGVSTKFEQNDDLKDKTKKRIKELHNSQGFDVNVSVICTLGAQGILYFQPGVQDGKISHLPAASLKRDLKDTTGAGDCFAGYFVAGLMGSQGEGIEGILKTCLTVSDSP